MLVTENGILVTVKVCSIFTSYFNSIKASEIVTIDMKIENILQFVCYIGENCVMIISYDNIAFNNMLNAFKINENCYLYDQHFKSFNRKVLTTFFTIKKNDMCKFESVMSKLPEEKILFVAIDRGIKLLKMYNIDEMEVKKIEEEESRITILKEKINRRNFTINICEYKTLSLNEHMSEKIIDYYINFWYSYKLSKADKRRSWVFSTDFYKSLTKKFSNKNDNTSKKRYERVIQTTKNVDIFKKDFIFVPINEKFQWFLAVICFPYLSNIVNFHDGTPFNVSDDDLISEYPQKRIELINDEYSEADLNIEDFRMFVFNTKNKQGNRYYSDTMVLKNKRPCILILDSSYGGFNRARVTATLREWLQEEYIAKHNGKKRDFSSKVMKGSLVQVPRQPNIIDSSLYMIHFLKMFFEKPIIDYTFPILHLEHWFLTSDVFKNNRKRKEIKDTINSRMNVTLPNEYQLPDIIFNNSNI